jgi:hypothetical protein
MNYFEMAEGYESTINKLVLGMDRVTVDSLENIRNVKKSKSVAKSAESGIIKEKSNKPITKITDKAIEKVPQVKIQGYSDEQCEIIQKQHQELLRYSRDNNDNKEVAFVFRNDFADKTPFIGEDDKLEFGSALIGKGNDLIVMHNHPRNSSYSTTDIEFFVSTGNVKTFTIVKNNGAVETITKKQRF